MITRGWGQGLGQPGDQGLGGPGVPTVVPSRIRVWSVAFSLTGETPVPPSSTKVPFLPICCPHALGANSERPIFMDRNSSVRQLLARDAPWDMAVIGGGATGVGIAVDAASRGYAVCLVEQSDFGKGTSSRSTKLVHGGVRYLQQGNVSLVMEALKERGILRQNAPHLVHNLAFVVPNYVWWEAPFYGVGMKVYDMLSGKYVFRKSHP